MGQTPRAKRLSPFRDLISALYETDFWCCACRAGFAEREQEKINIQIFVSVYYFRELQLRKRVWYFYFFIFLLFVFFVRYHRVRQYVRVTHNRGKNVASFPKRCFLSKKKHAVISRKTNFPVFLFLSTRDFYKNCGRVESVSLQSSILSRSSYNKSTCRVLDTPQSGSWYIN